MFQSQITVSKISNGSITRLRESDRSQLIGNYNTLKQQYETYLSHNQVKQLKQIYQHGICGYNKKQQLVIVDRIGCLKLSDVNKILPDNNLIYYTLQRLFYINEHILPSDGQVIWVIDLFGKVMQLASKKVIDLIHKLVKIIHVYFPNLLKRLIFVNVPMLFDSIWNKIAQCIEMSTRNKIIMIGTNLNQLYDYIEVSMLPKCLGGKISEQDWLYSHWGNHTQKQVNYENQIKYQDNSDNQDNDQQIDLSALKMALGGLNNSNSNNNKLQSVSQTPLNTEADENNP